MISRKIILGSNSPRRKELLTTLGYDFETRNISYEEKIPIGMHISSKDLPAYFAEQKASSVAGEIGDAILITADTLVFLDEEIMGKPQSPEDAFAMLKKLSGRIHHVRTGVCMKTKSETIIFTDASEVEFKELTDDEINFYIEYYKPFDKAGAYGAQDWIGMVAIKKITGSYFNVMGLPVHLVHEKLLKIK